MIVEFHDANLTEHKLAQGIYDFLSTVRELRSIPKKKEFLVKKRRFEKSINERTQGIKRLHKSN